MDAFVKTIQKQLGQLQRREELLKEAPQEFLDDLTGELMSDPVMLPNSRMILDRSNVERLLQEKPVDPYDRTPLTVDQLVPRRRETGG